MILSYKNRNKLHPERLMKADDLLMKNSVMSKRKKLKPGLGLNLVTALDGGQCNFFEHT